MHFTLIYINKLDKAMRMQRNFSKSGLLFNMNVVVFEKPSFHMAFEFMTQLIVSAKQFEFSIGISQ